jgi:PiT family inorganic phosphate transporter
MPDPQTLLLVLTIAIALLFDFTNGFHDTANAVGTAIGTRALPPRFAVGLTAILNLVGAVVTTQFLHAEVANTVGSLVAPAGGVAMSMLIAVLFGAITWNLFTWRAGLPSSSSHALIGALIGMGLAVYGLDAVQWGEVYPVLIALVTSPVVGLLIAYVLTVVLLNLFCRVRPSHANGVFRRLQLFSSAFVAFSHGANDAQKTMAIITLALFSSGHLPGFVVPVWVALAAAIAIGLGTWAGGWRIIRTMGTRIVRMQPVDGFAAQTAAAGVIQLATTWGLPVSTTQVVSGAVMGAGSTRRFSAVRWGVARRIVWAWIFTIPASAVLAASAALLITAEPLAVMFAVLILGAVTLVWVARRVSSRKRSALIDDVGAIGYPNSANERVGQGKDAAG